MKISYAHMGTATYAVEALLSRLGHEVIVPEPPTQDTLTLGTKYSPEFACIPFKMVLGTYLEVLERGAEVLVSGGGMGPCRAGYYGELHKRILGELGYDPEMIFFWPPLKTPRAFLRKVKRLKENASWFRVLGGLRLLWEKIKVLDGLEQLSHRLRPQEINRGSISKALERALDMIREADTVDETREAHQRGEKLLRSVKVRDVDPDELLRVGIIGEIYVQLEPAANFYLEEKLGELGAVAKRSIFMTDFTKEDVLNLKDESIEELAEPYIPENIGGHGRDSVGETIHYAKEGYDGVVQLAPFSCIPEIVAKSIMPALSDKMGIPVLTLFIDEQTGDAGIGTRLEAFVDMMRSRRRALSRTAAPGAD